MHLPHLVWTQKYKISIFKVDTNISYFFLENSENGLFLTIISNWYFSWELSTEDRDKDSDLQLLD